MKKLILKWLGLDTVVSDIKHLEDSTYKVVEELVNDEFHNQKWDFITEARDEIESDLDLESKVEDALLDSARDIVSLVDKVDTLDGRLTELVDGYQLEVQLIKKEANNG
tara:strand:+ start:244 stop:570 length:327 start_codon:yes stop_codon:yes gene_type:complete